MADPAPISRDAFNGSKQLSRYFAEAALLRTCLAYNEDDHLFAAENNGRIVYIFDANVVAFFLQPERENERRKVLAFGSDNRAYGYAAATALITAEFLFSRRLAGQRDNPALISPAHGDDLADILNRIQQDLPRAERDAVNDDNISQIEAMLNIVVERIRDREYDNIGQVAEELRTFVPRLADELEDRLAPLQQFSRIYEQDLLRPLALHTAATLAVLLPSSDEIKRWAGRIGAERTRRKKADSRTKSERDAIALVQTMALDEEARKGSEPIRYVLVTADMALFDAYASWYWELHEGERPRFVLRLPLQYVPILNTLEMPNSLRTDVVTRKAFLALDSLFGNLQQVEPNYERKLAYYRLLEEDLGDRRAALRNYFGGVDPLEIGMEAFDEARKEWHNCYLNGTVLNAPLMHRRHASAFEGLVHALRQSSELREALEKAQVNCLERIVGAHAEFTTRVTAADILNDLRSDTGPAMPPHRIPFLIRLEGCGLPVSVVDLLTGDVPPDVKTLERDLRDTIGEAQSEQSLLLASVIAFRRGHWIGARAFARHGLSVTTSVFIKLELYYLLAATDRYLLNALQHAEMLTALGEAEEALTTSIRLASQNGDSCIIRRAQIEQQALALTLCRLQLHDSLPVSSQIEARKVDMGAILDTSLALKSISAGRDCTPNMAAALSAHAQRVALGAALQIFLFGDGRPGRAAASVDIVETIVQLRPSMPTGWADLPIHHAHRLLGEWIGGDRDIEAVQSGLVALLDEPVSENWMSALDRLEIERSLAVLRQRSGLGVLGAIDAAPRQQAGKLRDADAEDLPDQNVIDPLLEVRNSVGHRWPQTER